MRAWICSRMVTLGSQAYALVQACYACTCYQFINLGTWCVRHISIQDPAVWYALMWQKHVAGTYWSLTQIEPGSALLTKPSTGYWFAGCRFEQLNTYYQLGMAFSMQGALMMLNRSFVVVVAMTSCGVRVLIFPQDFRIFILHVCAAKVGTTCAVCKGLKPTQQHAGPLSQRTTKPIVKQRGSL